MMIPFTSIVMWTFWEKVDKNWKETLRQSGKIAFVFSIVIDDVATTFTAGYFSVIGYFL